jgi:hypothetical protein
VHKISVGGRNGPLVKCQSHKPREVQLQPGEVQLKPKASLQESWCFCSAPETIAVVNVPILPKTARPGLAKAKQVPVSASQMFERVRTFDAYWRLCFERADIVSEGSLRGRTWFGTSSILLPVDNSVKTTGELVALAQSCVHFRTRAVRLAQREAQNRAPVALAASRCELRIECYSKGLKIDVEVEADILKRSAML